jgi:hypothetical protein
LNRGVYLERSRSKGWHVWVFFDAPVPARDIRRVLRHSLALAGLPASTEVFPKQDRLGNGTRLGNYVNLPYAGGDRPDGRRMMVNLDRLSPIGWERFVDEVERFPSGALSLVTDVLPGDRQSRVDQAETGWLAEMLASRIPVGARRPSLARLSGALRSHGLDEDTAVALALPWAATAFEEPLPEEEVERHVRGIYRRYGHARLDGLARRSEAVARSLGASQ